LTITATAQTTSNVSWWWVSGISATQFALNVWGQPGRGRLPVRLEGIFEDAVYRLIGNLPKSPGL
jgi:hypothetical protein